MEQAPRLYLLLPHGLLPHGLLVMEVEVEVSKEKDAQKLLF